MPSYLADDFTLATTSIVDEVRWSGVSSSVGAEDPPPDDFTVEF